MASVRVAVRLRPLNKREKPLSSIVNIMGNTTSVSKSSTPPGHELKVFSYDFSYDSADKTSPSFASQEKIYKDLGPDVLKAVFEGVNACVFAYGQTGSGKTYTMMGNTEDKGLIPRLCEGLYNEMDQRKSSNAVSFCTEVSYLEIYNERVHDLLKKAASGDGVLRVREHPLDGPYVENLSKCLVHNHDDMEDLMALGNTHRTTGSTAMNPASSRSHAIFTIGVTQAWFDADLPRKMSSKIHLVDLAGSERADAASTSGTRLKEGASINKSLVTLGSVISTLAEVGTGEPSTKKKIFIPYRDSVLTWLLKDSLGGNSVTTMIATISPSVMNYSETLSTLRYASRAKKIVNCPTVNEDHGGKLIRELKAEVTRLQRLLEQASQIPHQRLSSTAQAEPHHNNQKVPTTILESSNKWSERILQEETLALKEEGNSVVLNCHLPHLVGINEELLSNGIILYYLKEGRTLIGTDASCSQNIGEHCVLENLAGTVTLTPQEGALCSVNGSVLTGSYQLTQGAIIQLGTVTTLRFIQPPHKVQLGDHQEAEMAHQTTKDKHLLFYSSAYVYKFMEHLMKKILPIMQPQGGLLSALRPSLTDGYESAEKKLDLMPQTLGLDGKLNGSDSAITAIPGEYPILHNSFHLDKDSQQGGKSTGEGQREEAPCHKSEPGRVSKEPQKAQSVAEHASFREEVAWSGDASLQLTSVLGPGDGCGAKQEGNANKIQDAMADCSEGKPGSESSLSSMSPLQSNGENPSATLLPQTPNRSWPEKKQLSSRGDCSPEKSSSKTQFCSEALKENSGASPRETVATRLKKSGMTTLVSNVSWLIEDAEGLFWIFLTALQQVRKEGLEPVWAYWSSQVLPLLKERNIITAVTGSKLVSVVKANLFPLFNNGKIVSVVKDLPPLQLMVLLRQTVLSWEMFWIFQDYMNLKFTNLSSVAPAQGSENKQRLSVSLTPKGVTTNKDFMFPYWQNISDFYDKMMMADLQIPDPGVPEIRYVHADEDPQVENLSVQIAEGVQNGQQTLIEFSDCLLSLQILSLPDLTRALKLAIPALFNFPKIVAVYWLSVVKCRQDKPCPALLILVETGLYTLTDESGLLVLFHELPLIELKELRINLAGQSLCLMAAADRGCLHVCTYSQKLTKALCCAILSVTHPGDERVSQHPLLSGDLMQMSLNWTSHVPALQLDAGLRVSCNFQKSLVDLSYCLHQNMDQETVFLGDMRLLFYTTVGVCLSSYSKPLAQLVLTDTHLGLLQEALYSAPPVLCRLQFQDLTLRQRSDVRCVVVHGEDEKGAVRLDVILANAKGRGRQESVTKAATPSGHILDSSPHVEVWKLTFSCSSEAACLINHLSNV